MKKLLLISFSLILIGCSTTNYSKVISENENTASLRVELTSPMESVHVFIDGERVFNNTKVGEITLTGIEAGEREIKVVGADANRIDTIDHTETIGFESGKESLVLLNTPPLSSGFYAMEILSTVGMFLIVVYLM